MWPGSEYATVTTVSVRPSRRAAAAGAATADAAEAACAAAGGGVAAAAWSCSERAAAARASAPSRAISAASKARRSREPVDVLRRAPPASAPATRPCRASSCVAAVRRPASSASECDNRSQLVSRGGRPVRARPAFALATRFDTVELGQRLVERPRAEQQLERARAAVVVDEAHPPGEPVLRDARVEPGQAELPADRGPPAAERACLPLERAEPRLRGRELRVQRVEIEQRRARCGGERGVVGPQAVDRPRAPAAACRRADEEACAPPRSAPARPTSGCRPLRARGGPYHSLRPQTRAITPSLDSFRESFQ